MFVCPRNTGWQTTGGERGKTQCREEANGSSLDSLKMEQSMTRIIDSFTCGLEITICTRRAGEQEREESEGRGKREREKKHSLATAFSIQ